jgi:hypothetical protein
MHIVIIYRDAKENSLCTGTLRKAIIIALFFMQGQRTALRLKK